MISGNVLQHCTLSEWVCVGYFSSALDRSMCGFISSNSNVLCNIWWDYLQKLSSLEALEVSSCRLRNSLIKLIAFMLLKLLNCVILNKKGIFEDFLGIVAHFRGSSVYGTHPTVKHMIQNSAEHRKAERHGKIWAKSFKDTQTPSAVLFKLTVFIHLKFQQLLTIYFFFIWHFREMAQFKFLNKSEINSRIYARFLHSVQRFRIMRLDLLNKWTICYCYGISRLSRSDTVLNRKWIF